MGPPVVRVAGELTQGVVADHDVRPDLTDVCDQAADGLVQRSVNEAYAAGCRGGDTGIGVPEQPRGAGAQDVQGVGEFGDAVGVGRPSGGDDSGAGARGGVLGEHAAGEEGFVIRMGEDAEE
ncbi:hypothetical protein Snoj_25980 [Streptomyces nojiriensis]|uniref:Uncharacterized protein n=1 Tax=Streptomyces nojiriensis TaxID=66374 RepID=A0ABQ3SKL4_9ACTN|nr:hypothetical protein GCM10010205_69580 [Streptomyces nojiriensis]GHI68680.1 hypothetical protein Snoj_25980 [Streptomyces nojiriensis]